MRVRMTKMTIEMKMMEILRHFHIICSSFFMFYFNLWMLSDELHSYERWSFLFNLLWNFELDKKKEMSSLIFPPPKKKRIVNDHWNLDEPKFFLMRTFFHSHNMYTSVNIFDKTWILPPKLDLRSPFWSTLSSSF